MGNHSDIVILGAGLSGLGAAWHIKRKKPDMKTTLIEKLPYLGGLASSPVFENKYYLDFGPHLLTVESKSLLNLIKKLIGNDLLKMDRHCLLYFNNRYMSYPPSPKNVLFELGIKTAFLSTTSYIKSKLSNPKKFNNFEEWSRYNFGDYLHKIFFKPYTENFWGMKCSELASKWADARVSKMSFTKAILSLFIKSMQNTSIVRDKLPIYYPKLGTGDIPLKMAKRLKEKGVKINPGLDVRKIKIYNNKKKKKFEITCYENKKKKVYTSDYLISTIPITQFIEIVEPKPSPKIITAASNLKFRSLLVMYIITNKKNILNAPYIYYQGRSYHRLTESNKISKSLCPEGENMLCIEKSCFTEDEIWKYDKKKLIDIFIKDLEKDGILNQEDIIKTFLLKEKYVYPVYSLDFDKQLSIIKEYLGNLPDYAYLGRPGAFMYLDMDQSIERSFKVIEKFIQKNMITKK